jgi:hypothetical protein
LPRESKGQAQKYIEGSFEMGDFQKKKKNRNQIATVQPLVCRIDEERQKYSLAANFEHIP